MIEDGLDRESGDDQRPWRGWDDTCPATGDARLPAKARRLVALARAGLPVPPGVVVSPEATALDDPAILAHVRALLRRGPVVVRSALHGEDELESSAAGLGRSWLGCTDLDSIATALADLATQRQDPWLVAYRTPTTTSGRGDHVLDRAIVQQQVPRRALLVLAVDPGGSVEVEVHTADGEALAQGRTPEFAGLLDAWDDPACDAVRALVARAIDVLPSTPHGHDLEVVIDPHARAHLVQARPLVAPLHPGWSEFHAALVAEGQADELHGVLTLDAEHNPVPLSPAHAWLMGWLRTQRPRAGDPTVLAGWLYVRTLPRDLGGDHAKPSSSPSERPSARAVLTELQEHTLPRARARLHAVERALSTHDPHAVAGVLPVAQQAFLAMIDTYVGVLIPARTLARRALGPTIVADPRRPLSTRGREGFLDVLPATWDLASKSLAELGAHIDPSDPRAEPVSEPPDEATATILLGEHDDHLFALGLAPLRAWHLAAARGLGLPEDDAFMLEAPELATALTTPTGSPPDLRSLVAARRAQHERRAALRPPLRIHDGRPVSFGRRARLRGIPLGPSFTGVLAPRPDLAALLAEPPGPDAIVVLPSLTAPAAVALERLGIRAVCCEHGGPLSHAALMARELGLSALIGCRDCTTLPAGQRARIDTRVGRLILDPS
ncbi:PEP-utilizing enzyme [Paraliomyxa miuraensis]|uniref:PEP-utilizing enzyme n=1 Tax=Paraliomyxa miuraensis TaxID=376150 RepID=UPI00225728E3|nr:PEP-utilizing enzyme [Paraliomyxa miuraensis]MCX4240267.1 PEP-utilizing enzyme [Paraliomyxa miuraensis]